VSVNGKLRDKLDVDAETSSKEVEALALASERIKAYTDGHEIVKIIVVPKKIVNIVIK
jgi:leucyl-tRNA synthetase